MYFSRVISAVSHRISPENTQRLLRQDRGESTKQRKDGKIFSSINFVHLWGTLRILIVTIHYVLKMFMAWSKTSVKYFV